ncbi:MAG: hypothetical protein ACR2HJ_10645 [Fimbriimonadales bacterium]
MKHTASAITIFLAICANAQWTVFSLNPTGFFRAGLGCRAANRSAMPSTAHITHANLWTGTRGSWVDLTPQGATESGALDVDGGHRAGWATVGGIDRASLWTGTAGSWVDLHPQGAARSIARGVDGGQQVGNAFGGIMTVRG